MSRSDAVLRPDLYTVTGISGPDAASDKEDGGAGVGDSEAAAAKIDAVDDRATVTCDKMKCQRGGVCLANGARCRCPLGTRGQHCERDVTVRYPKFSGTGYVAFPTLRDADREFTIDIDFRPDNVTMTSDKDGGGRLLLFGSEHPDAVFDFFSVSVTDGGHVEFRFDCGTGLGIARTRNTVLLGKWNTLRVLRSDWNAHVVLNNGPEAHAKSKGLFTKMKFRNELFLGGHSNLSMLSKKVAAAEGFVGCVNRLKINKKLYDMRRGLYVGDALHGFDVDECSVGSCDKVRCENGGTCVVSGADTSTCLCALGVVGDRCESKIDVIMPSFSGQSYLQYIGLRRSLLNYATIEMVLRPTNPDGLILYDGYATDGTGDFISLALRNRTIEFRYDLGTGPAIIRTAQPVTLNEWHVVKLWRSGRHGSIRVDGQSPVNGSAPGAFTQLTLTLDMFLGGHRNFDEVARNADVVQSFKGCVQKLVINERSVKLISEALTGVNVDDCRQHPCSSRPCLNGGLCLPSRDSYRCRCPVGFDSLNCEIKTSRYRYRYRYRRDV